MNGDRLLQVGTMIIDRELAKAMLDEIERALTTEEDLPPRPKTRGECVDGPRPCPWVSCKHHLYLSVNPDTGTIKLPFPDLEPWELSETCVLDVAQRGEITLEEVGNLMNITRERVRQIEKLGFELMRPGMRAHKG